MKSTSPHTLALILKFTHKQKYNISLFYFNIKSAAFK